MKIICFLLSLCLMFSSCKSSEENISQPTEKPDFSIDSEEIKYNLKDFPYVRPDLLKSADDIKPFLSMAVISENEKEALYNFKKAVKEINNISSQWEILFARTFSEPENIRNKAETIFAVNNIYYLNLIKHKLYKAYESSPHKNYICDNLSESEKSLVKSSVFTPLNLEDSMDYYLSQYRIIQHMLSEKKLPSADKAEETLMEIIKLRNKKALRNDFKNYCDLIISEKPYNIKEIHMLTRYVKEFIFPVKDCISKPYKSFDDFSPENLSDESSEYSYFVSEMLKDAASQNTFYSESTVPLFFYMNYLSVPFINYKPANHTQQSFLNKIIGENTHFYCIGMSDKTLGKICGYIYDVLSDDNSVYKTVQEITYLSMLSEFYEYIYTEENLTLQKLRNYFSYLAKIYYPKAKEESLYNISLLLCCMGEYVPFDLFTAAQVSCQLEVIKSNDLIFAENIFSALLVSQENHDIKSLLRSCGLDSPFDANSLRISADFFAKQKKSSPPEEAREEP